MTRRVDGSTTAPRISRRSLLRLTASAGAASAIGALVAGCASPTPAGPGGAGTTAAPSPAASPVVPAAVASSAGPIAPAASPQAAPAVAFDPNAEVTIAQGVAITDLDASMQGGNLTLGPSLHLLEPLVTRDLDLRLRPLLAEAYDYVDTTTLRVKLRPNITFHNGDPLTPADVVFTLKRVTGPESKSYHARFTRNVVGAEAIDDRTVEIKLSAPEAGFIGRLSLIPIVPQKVVERVGDEEFNGAPVGTGPYRFVSWQRGDRVVLEVYPNYWREPARLKRVVFRGITEDATRVAELRTGAVDIVQHVPTDLVAQLKAAGNTEIMTTPSVRTLYVLLNSKQPPFDNPKMRQAVNYAVDKELIKDGILDGYAAPTSQPFGKEVLGFVPELDNYYAYNPDRAKALLAEAGYAGEELTLIYPPGRFLKGDEVAQNLADQLGKAGVRIKLLALEFQTYFDNYIQKYNDRLHLGLWSNANDTLEADYNLQLNAQSPPRGRGFYWSDPALDAVIQEAARTLDPAERERVYQRGVRKIVEDAGWLFLYNQVDVYGVSKRLEGWQPRANEVLYTYGAYVAR